MAQRFSILTIAFNAELFLEACLRSVYDFAHEILIVEGSVPQARLAAKPDGTSTDRTLDIIRRFPDPQRKLKLVASRAWIHKDEMVNAACKQATGDYLFQVDSDEIWSASSLGEIRRVLAGDPSITCLSFRSLTFWRNFRTVLVGGHWDGAFTRLWRFEPGARFRCHEPPILLDPSGRRYDSYKHVVTDIPCAHPAYVTDDQVKAKAEFYLRYHQDAPSSDDATQIGMTRDWYQKVWQAWETDPARVEHVYGTSPGGGPAWGPQGRTERYDGPLPDAIVSHQLYRGLHSNEADRRAPAGPLRRETRQHGGGPVALVAYTASHRQRRNIIAEAWRRIGFEPVFIAVDVPDAPTEDIRTEAPRGANAAAFSKLVHVFRAQDERFRNRIVLVSDPDLVPLSGGYFRYVSDVPPGMLGAPLADYSTNPNELITTYMTGEREIWRQILEPIGQQPPLWSVRRGNAALESLVRLAIENWSPNSVAVGQRGWWRLAATASVAAKTMAFGRLDIADGFDGAGLRAGKYLDARLPAEELPAEQRNLLLECVRA